MCVPYSMVRAMQTGTVRSVHTKYDFKLLSGIRLLTNFETRKSARAGEIDALTKAKAVLSGADYSLLQSAHVRHVAKQDVSRFQDVNILRAPPTS